MSDYQRGQNHMRDTVIAMCIGFQNALTVDDNENTYKAYQNVIDTLESRYGEFMSKERLKLFHTLREVKPWIILHPDYILTAGSYKILEIYEQQHHSLAKCFVN